MPPTRRRGASPSAEDLAGLGETTASGGGRLRKAPSSDPVLGVGGSRAAAAPEPASQSAPQAPSSSSTPRRTSAGAKTKVGFYQDPDDVGRARAAYDWTRPHTKHRSFSDFIAAAVMREVERLELEYHDGEPWPAMEPGELPTGKPLGA